MNKIEYLNYRAEDEREDFEFYIDHMDADDRRKIIRSFWTANEIWFLEEIFVKNNFTQAKRNCYHCALLDKYIITHFDFDPMDYGMDRLTYILLSDNRELIQECVNLYPYNEQVLNENVLLYAMLSAIRKDEEGLRKSIDFMNTQIETDANYHWMLTDKNYFEGLLNRDKKPVEKAINQLTTDHDLHKENGDLIGEFISHPALGYAKLAWYLGIEIDINSSLVPKELLPIQPLDNYDIPYAFLKEDEE